MTASALDRRDLLRLLAGAGLVAAVPRRADADLPNATAPAPYAGPFLVTVHAGGGWDATHLCDPKPSAGPDDAEPINNFLPAAVQKVGPFSLGPTPGAVAFFQKHQARLIVYNGMDFATNGHDSGTRNAWSGTLVEGYPALAAMFAANKAPLQPLAFLSSGGYDHTANLIAPTRVGNVANLQRLVVPNVKDVNNPDRIFHAPWVWQKLQERRAKRLARRLQAAVLPQTKSALQQLQAARSGVTVLDQLVAKLPAKLDATNNPLKRQAEITAATFAAGLGAAASLTLGGFDTHANHDASHLPRLEMLLQGVDYLHGQLVAQGIADKTIIVVGSDFGRTPGYNAGKGKDHWSITSAMVLGPTTGPLAISGGRVVGASTDGHHARELDPTTLQPVADGKGVRLTPAALHRALREHLGLTGSEADLRFLLEAPKMPLLVKP
ncbi:MAG: hypothetical protein RIT45_3831 [Pseudomonadota bacterium]